MEKKWSDKIPQRSPLGKQASQDDAGLETIVLVTGMDMEGNPQWAYAEIPADKFIAFKQAEAHGNYKLQDFGTILASGTGETPPPSVQQEMADKYGCDANFEADLEEMFGDMMVQFSEMIEQFSHYIAEGEAEEDESSPEAAPESDEANHRH